MEMLRFLIILCFALKAYAIPEFINYQGFLTDSTGAPLDTTVTMSVRLYDGPDPGAFFIFNEIHVGVQVQNGLFNLLIGQYVGLPDLAFQFSPDSMWVGIEIGSDEEMTPRHRLVSVGNAYRVGTVDRASGGEITGDLIVTGKGQYGPVTNTPTGDYSFIAGFENDSRGRASVTLGEDNSTSNSNWNSVTGGLENIASGTYSHIGGGTLNLISLSDYATIAGGRDNSLDQAANSSSIGGGYQNVISSGLYSGIAGGYSNEITQNYAHIGGGYNNTVTQFYGTISGGRDNQATAQGSTVGGGRNSHAAGDFSVVAGGGGATAADANVASGLQSFIGGGRDNQAMEDFSIVAGGSNNIANGDRATVSGGLFCRALAHGATVGGGDTNMVNVNSVRSAILGGGSNHVNTNATSSTIGGGYNNTIESLVDHAFIGGGLDNVVDADFGTVVGGQNNSIATAGIAATVVGGSDNIAGPGDYSFVGGGRFNDAEGTYSGVLCGYNNTSDGNSSIAGGVNTTVNGEKSFGYGSDLTLNSDSAFAFTDGSAPLTINSDKTFSCLATGAGGLTDAVRFWTSSDLSSGLRLLSGGSNWISVSDSTKKRNIRTVNTSEILAKVEQLPIKQWSYKSQDPSVEHVGPMAQDFWKTFHLGGDSLGIGTIDPAGIALAAIQELAKLNNEKDIQIADLESRVNQLEAAILQFGNLNQTNKQ